MYWQLPNEPHLSACHWVPGAERLSALNVLDVVTSAAVAVVAAVDVVVVVVALLVVGC